MVDGGNKMFIGKLLMKFLRELPCALFGHKYPKLTRPYNWSKIFSQKCVRCGWKPALPDIVIPNDIYVEIYNGTKPKPLFHVGDNSG